MKKNVFEGFEGLETQQLEAVRGGIEYSATYRNGSQCDEKAITAAGEYDPWSDTYAPYSAEDATWDNCSGITTDPSGSGSGTATGTR